MTDILRFVFIIHSILVFCIRTQMIYDLKIVLDIWSKYHHNLFVHNTVISMRRCVCVCVCVCVSEQWQES